jgi:hypothetical protein
MNTVVQAFLVFGSNVLFDFAYVQWMASCNRLDLARAVFWAPVIPAIALFGLLSAQGSYVCAIAYVAGQTVGTALSVYLGRRRRPMDDATDCSELG